MKIVIFLTASLLQILFAFWIASNYVRLQRDLGGRPGVRCRFAELALFLLFVLTVIPIGMFFPLWLGEAVEVLPPTRNNRVILLALGGAGLVASFGFAWRRANKRAYPG